MSHAISLVVIAKAVSLGLGALVTYFSYRAYRRTRAPPLRALAVGFALVTVGALVGGLIDLFVEVDRSVALVTESGFSAVGFAVIVYSLYVD